MKSVVASPARVAVLAMVLLLSACSVLQMVYSQAPRYVQWRSNVAHHFNAEQYSLVKAVVHRWFAWHRQDQMPRVAVLLALAANDVRGPISPALACERRDAYLALAKQGLAQAAPLAAAVMVQLGPDQLSRVQTFFADINDDFRDDYLADDPREQAELAVIEEFLPQQMGEDETKAAIEAIKAELGATSIKDMGKVIAELKARHGTQLDMGKASGLVKAALG